MSTWICTRQNELTHHGIKGQKWGVRRFQNKDGSLTPAGKKRYDEYGMRYGVKVEYDKSKMDKDVVLKKGTHIQNISSDGARDVSKDRPVYGAHTKHDKDAYGGRFAKAVDTRYGIAIKNDLVLLKDVKVASQKQAVDTFMEMYKKDPKGVAESIGRAHAEMTVLQNNMPAGYKDWVADRITQAYLNSGENWVKSKGYVVFNESMVSVKESEARNKYYDLLIKKGYGAIRDINDINDGYADDPVIFINAKSTMKNVNHRELTIAEMEIAKARYEYDKARRFDDPLQRAVSTKSAKRNLKAAEKNSGVKKRDSYTKQRAKLDKMVKRYIKEHPNTNLTQSEIEEMLQRNELQHHGIKGQKWGVRRFQNKDGSLTPAGKERYYVDNDSSTAITKNSDGSYTVPTGFKFNRVGQQTLDVNKSGVLYVSYGKEDAARYVKSLGPTLISRLIGGNGQAVQHIEAKKPLRMASEAEVYKGFAEVAAKNKKILDRVNDDDISRAIVGYGKDWSTKVTKADAEYAVNNPNSFAAKRMGQAVSFWMGDSRYAAEASILYKHFKDKGYDAIPDITDRDGGGFDTSMIIINTDKITMTSSTKITRDIMKDAKSFVKTLAEKPYEDIYQDIDAIDAYKEKHPNTKMTDSEIGKMLGY